MSTLPGDPVSEVMRGETVSVDLGAPIREVIEAMADQEIGSVIVTEMDQVVGIITERDVIVTVCDGGDLDSTYAADIMSEGPFCADPSDTLGFTLERMVQYGVQHIPVIRAGRPVGMVSARDVLRAMSEQEKWAASNGAV